MSDFHISKLFLSEEPSGRGCRMIDCTKHRLPAHHPTAGRRERKAVSPLVVLSTWHPPGIHTSGRWKMREGNAAFERIQ